MYLGYTLKPRLGWEQLVPEPKAPSNYKDDVKIAQYVAEAKKKQAAEAAERVLTGEINEIAFIDVNGNPGFIDPLNFLSIVELPATVVCVHPLLLLRMVVAAYVTKNGALPTNCRWAVRNEVSGAPVILMHGDQDVVLVDPLRALVCSTAAENTDPEVFAKRFNFNPAGTPGTAIWMASLAQLAGRAIGV